MAVATPRLAPPAAAAPSIEPTDRAPQILLLAVVACYVGACFAGGGQSLTQQRWVDTGLALCATGAAGAWLYARGLSLRPSWLGVAGVVGLVGFAAWSAISIGWSVAPDRSWSEANRSLGFAFVVFAGLVIGSSLPRAAERVGIALAVGTLPVALYALGGKTIPGFHIGGLIDLNQTGYFSRLRAPLQYWNALAMVCVSGAIPMLRLCVDTRRSERVRLAAIAGLYVLVLTTALTYSRGGVAVLLLGVATLVALGTERVRTVLVFGSVVVAGAIPLTFALSRKALTIDALPLSVREQDSFYLFLITLAAGGLLVVWGRALLRLGDDPRFTAERGRAVGRRAAIVLGAALALTAVVLLATGTVADQFHKFKNPKATAAVTDPNRLLSTNSSNRWAWWREAAGGFSDKPLKGWGADSFRVVQRLYRRDRIDVEQPHSVPLQFLVENGLIGFLLGAGALLALLAAGLARVRSLPFARTGAPPARGAAAALFAVALAWIVQCFFEWTWNIPAATFPMLLCLGVLAARPTGAPTGKVPGRTLWAGGAAIALVLVITSVTLPAVAADKTKAALLASGVDNPSPATLEHIADQADYAARLNPLAIDALGVAADVAARRGRPDEQRADLIKRVRRQPYDVLSWIDLLIVEVGRGDRAGAVAAAHKVLELDPYNPKAVDLARTTLQNQVFPNESATAGGTPLVTTVPADDPRPAVP
ncbi:MAG: hypothetical protein QOF76_5316 [Solirubrobacteraceae bacterium]|nr:hypothetical protein [Solirubrobacteraceae bacterium]